ncbi:carph-isopro domain-containing protein [Paenirhodobacter populi]|uniref:carph-isopro domain-containing protein n=1 Tax=Paenirhodobacter populi TaxID=2306993 RepID=UPI00361AB211
MEKVFCIWPNAAELAREIGENPVTVRSWRARGSIPADRDVILVRAAAKRGAVLTVEELAEARRKRASQERVV